MRISNNLQLENYKKLKNLSFFAFMLNWPNFVLTFIAAIYSNTIVVWIDTLVTLSESLHTMIVWLVALKMCKENGDKYNFGMQRLEAFVSFLIEMLISFGMVGMIVGAVLNIITPEAPTSSLFYFCLMKVSCVIWDIVLYVKELKIYKVNPSKLIKTEKTSYLISLINDSAMGVIAVVCFAFRTNTFVQYLSPIASIVLAIYFLIGYINHMRVSVAEIVDRSIPVKKQDAIYDIVLNNKRLIKRIINIKCRTINDKNHIEISLSLQDDITYKDMTDFLTQVRTEIEAIEPESEVLLLIGEPSE